MNVKIYQLRIYLFHVVSYGSSYGGYSILRAGARTGFALVCDYSEFLYYPENRSKWLKKGHHERDYNSVKAGI